MEHEAKKFCPALWLSGFFALGAVAHLVRFVLNLSLAVNGQEIPLAVSGAVGVVFTVLSTACFWVSQKRPCEKLGDKKAGHSCCSKKAA